MKSFLFLAILAFFAITAVMALFFRDEKAKSRLKFFRNVAYGYIIAIVLLAVYRMWFA
ncbi:MAG: hypothetical protein KJ048_05010 [Dehalococcoidia bacterium]|nr:hypothetical protein [Dehalococcoidia bacterium]MCL4240693.1 hypothetical protein [Dehalococcoidia bacterium]